MTHDLNYFHIAIAPILLVSLKHKMDAEERPQKIRKLSHEAADSSIANFASDSANNFKTADDVVKQDSEDRKSVV